MSWIRRKFFRRTRSFRELHSEVLNRIAPETTHPGKRPTRNLPTVAVTSEPREREIPLQVVLSGEANLGRPRRHTRIGDASQELNLLQNWLNISSRIDAQSVLCAGFAATELGIKVLRAEVPRGRTAMEELRLLRAACHRFDLGLILSADSDEEALEVAHWCHAIELPFPEAEFNKGFLRQLNEMGRALILRRCQELDVRSFLAGYAYLREFFANPLIVLEEVVRDSYGRYSYDHSALGFLALEVPVLLDLQSDLATPGEQETNGLAAISSGASGVVISVNTDDELSLSESFADDVALLKKLDAIRYTMNALRHF